MPDIKAYIKSLQTAWIPRVITDKKEAWVALWDINAQSVLGCNFIDLLSTTAYDLQTCDQITKLPEFLSNVLIGYNEAKHLRVNP